MIYAQAEEYINSIPKFTTKNNPEHTKEFLRILGDPQESFKTIHVAGSNGKGSVCALIHRTLVAGKKRSGLFTSPHLEKLVERFQIGEENCSQEEFLCANEEVRNAVCRLEERKLPHPTFFEYLFAVGMVIFRNAGVEYGVIETGLGGRLDATNVLKKPLVTVITSISLEHTEILGNTIGEIAGEKAGIIKQNVPVVFDSKNQEAAAVILQRAIEKNAQPYPVGPELRAITEFGEEGIAFRCKELFPDREFRLPFPAQYQAENASLALYALSLLMKTEQITEEEIEEGFATVKWPGRMEKAGDGIYLDGAHNAAGIGEFMKTAERIGSKGAVLLFSMVREKNYHEVIQMLSGENFWTRIIVTQVNGARQISAHELGELFRKETSVPVEVYGDNKEAYQRALEVRGTAKLFCTGSLYLIGELKKIIRGGSI